MADTNTNAKRPDDDTMNALAKTAMSLYQAKNNAEIQDILKSSYSPEAVFEDPVVYVHSGDIAAQFRALAAIFGKVEVNTEDMNPLPAPRTGMAIRNVQNYYIMGRALSIQATTELDMVEQNGKWVVAKHHDVCVAISGSVVNA
ncbi:hypothetical protein SeMB42_g04411 [Synchytrium endobioticum]|uniref:SnoaL-like domain-containing protein n=1 Tax=Synchytrium endobioticum TaxID=286115 RepID=A0A507CYQ6_9FUNG|nr:hypothetical protein SeMB42_g04411 [Synchytrium endobioticum]TPX46031.1 hypothetical protein SeLEV6574_g03479 [Synchytrium endobioticum]